MLRRIGAFGGLDRRNEPVPEPGDDAAVVTVVDADPVGVVLAGAFTMKAAARLKDVLASLVKEDDHRDVVVDLERVVLLDSSTLGVLVGGWKRMNATDRDLRLQRPGPRILRTLRTTGLDQLFQIEP